jgi:tRNA-dihydrouridine synthase 1
MKGKFPGNADWNAVRELKRHLNVPVIANGNIRDKEDADRCMAETGCDGVMSAWGLLDNPALFSGESISGKPLRQIQIAREYGAITEVHETTRKLQDAHYYPILFEMCVLVGFFKK